ncbi:hypothetical protein [Shimia sp. NS0008-38b]
MRVDIGHARVCPNHMDYGVVGGLGPDVAEARQDAKAQERWW